MFNGGRDLNTLPPQADTDGDPSTACGTCGTGTFAAKGAARCVPCAIGRYDHDHKSKQHAKTACVLCAAGAYASSTSAATTCTPCAAGLFDHDKKAYTQCQACKPGPGLLCVLSANETKRV